MKMKTNLDGIAKFYIQLGYKGQRLRKALESDKEYKKLVDIRKQNLKKKFKISQKEEKRYVLSVDRDFEILNKCKMLEVLKLPKESKELVRLIKSQLEDDWREPLIKSLDKLLKKYKR